MLVASLLLYLCILTCFLVLLVSYTGSGRQTSAKMSMLFGGKKAAPKKAVATAPGAGKSEYIPDGLTKAQYEATKKVALDKKAAAQKKFYKGKDVETLTEWMLAEQKKGINGKDLLTKSHRMVKAKYDGWYVDKNSQLDGR